MQANEAIKILSGRAEAISRTWNVLDLWDNQMRQTKLDSFGDRSACPACSGREYPWLEGKRGSHTAVLCGRNSVQIHERGRRLDLDQLRGRLAPHGEVRNNAYLLRFRVPPYELTVFADGRAIIHGTTDPGLARGLYARYIGA